MGFCSYHIQKGKASAGGLGNHIDRISGYEHSFNNADPDRTHLNISYPCNGYEKISLPEAIEKRIKEGYNARNKAGELKEIRKDACRFSEHVFTGTHEDMKAIEANPQRLQEWVLANRKFAEEMYGADNIVRFTLHLDEKTPHIHCIIVNLTKDGRLSAKDILGNPKELKKKQDKYAEYMKPFGLKRGLEDTGIKHENAKEYYKRINNSLDEMKELEVWEDKTNIFGQKSGEKKLNVEKSLQNYINQNTAVKDELYKTQEKLRAACYREFVALRRVEQIKEKEVNLEDREEKIREREINIEVLEDKISSLSLELNRINTILKEEKSKNEMKNEEIKKLEAEKAKMNEEINELTPLKKYKGLKNSKKYIEDSIQFRESMDIAIANSVMEKLLSENTYRKKEDLEEDFYEGMKKMGVVYNHSYVIEKEFERLCETLEVQFRKSKGIGI